MKKQPYRVRFRAGAYAAGDIVELTQDEATRLENETPGLLELAPEAAPPKPAPKPAKDET